MRLDDFSQNGGRAVRKSSLFALYRNTRTCALDQTVPNPFPPRLNIFHFLPSNYACRARSPTCRKPRFSFRTSPVGFGGLARGARRALFLTAPEKPSAAR